jgi:hypothetical protein
MHARTQRFLLWTAIFGGFLGGFGFFQLAGFLPPPSPGQTTDQIVTIYQTNTNIKRLGFMLMMFGGGLAFSFPAIIAWHMRRIKSEVAHMLTYAQIVLGTANVLILLIPSFIFTVTAFRPDRSPEVTVALHDLAWIIATMPVSCFILQQIVIAVAILSDKSDKPIFPRWLAYVNVWTALIYMPTVMITFFKTGPFAWNGILSFWVVAVDFVAWQVCMFVTLFKAIRAEEAQSRLSLGQAAAA